MKKVRISRSRVPAVAMLLLFLGAASKPAAGDAAGVPTLNGFRLSSPQVSVDEIHKGGPPRDGIPALTAPAVLTASEAAWGDDERMIGMVVNGQARAYPIAILNWHELVNDVLGEIPILVSYCPLCGTGMVFERDFADKTRIFGVSGLLYRSDVLLYDRETESLWSQIASRAVTGPEAGKRLVLLRSEQQTWGRWRREHPESTVLSPQTGYPRNYSRSPYGGYASSNTFDPRVPKDARYHPKMLTLGIRLPNQWSRAYPALELEKAGGVLSEEIGGLKISISYTAERRVFEVEAPPEIEVIEGYWFAWAAFHPESTVFVAPKSALRGHAPGAEDAATVETAVEGD